MDGSPGDLTTKYHKIAGEYSKLRAQVSVLKKAVIDEQNTNGELKESLREAEQSLRKADQEADSLNFRNEQLTRRVMVLQNELDTLQNQNKNKKLKGKTPEGQQSEFTNHVIDEEFRKKILENARLLSLMNEKEDEHRQELTNVTSQLDQVTYELDQLRKCSSEAEEKNRAQAVKLEREMSCMREGQQQLTDVSHDLAHLRKIHSDYRNEMEAKVNLLMSVIASQLPFIDSDNELLSSLNVPRMVDNKGSWTSEAGESLRASLQQLAASLALWHRVTEARVQKLPTADSAINIKYCNNLGDLGESALELEHCLSPSKMCKVVAQRLPGKLDSYCNHLESSLSQQRLSIEEEETGEATDEELMECNRMYLGKTSLLVNYLIQINSMISMYKSMQNSAEAQQKHRRGLISMTSLLEECFKDLFNTFVLKSGMEGERSWATEDLKSANQSVINSLSSLRESSAKVASRLSELWKSASSTPLPHPAVADLRRRGVHYLNSIHTEEAPSIPYHQALKDHEEAHNSREVREALLRQLAENKEQLIRAEQESEVWQQELKMLQLKIEPGKEERNWSEDSTCLLTSTVTNMLGSLDVPVNLPKEIELREEAMKLYFRKRINKLIGENRELESKSTAISAESSALVHRLEASVSSGLRLEEVLHEAKERAAQLQEEVTTTATNYEAQLSTMSEHLASMNEKLAQQKDTIDQLEYQLANKKKGRK